MVIKVEQLILGWEVGFKTSEKIEQARPKIMSERCLTEMTN